MPDIDPSMVIDEETSPDIYLTDNSRIRTMQQCPRKRYWNNEFQGRGIVSNRNSVALSKGLAIHKGVETLNRSLINPCAEPPYLLVLSPENLVETAVKAALDEFDTRASAEELEVELGTTEDYLYKEQKALIEFAVRGYALTRLPQHKQTHRFVSVEKEHLLQLTDRIILMGRTDGVEQKIDTSGHYIFEFKTSFAWDDLISQEYSIDLQGLSSILQVEAEFNQANIQARVDGINMEFFINGSRKKDKKDNVYKQETWTIRPWMKTGAITGSEFKWKYWYQDAFGNNHNLGKTFQRVNIWEIMPIKEWVEMLASGSLQPELGDPFQSVFIAPTPYYRDQQDVDSFITQTIAQEERVIEGIQLIREEESESEKQRLLDKYFPQHRHSCINKYRKVCPYWGLCWGRDGLDKMPVESGLFKLREAHHDAEKVMLGGIEGEES